MGIRKIEVMHVAIIYSISGLYLNEYLYHNLYDTLWFDYFHPNLRPMRIIDIPVKAPLCT